MDLDLWRYHVEREFCDSFMFYWQYTYYCELPCWGPMPRIISGWSAGVDYQYHCSVEGGEPEFNQPHRYDTVLFIRNLSVSWSILRTHYGRRFEDMSNFVKDTLEKRGIDHNVYTTTSLLFIPGEVWEQFTKVEIMALAMYAREMAKIDYQAEARFPNANLSNLLGNLDTYRYHYWIDELAKQGFHEWHNSGHYPWPTTLSYADQQLLVLRSFQSYTYEWPSEVNSSLWETIDNCGSWTDSTTAVWNWMTPNNPMSDVPPNLFFETFASEELKQGFGEAERHSYLRFDSMVWARKLFTALINNSSGLEGALLYSGWRPKEAINRYTKLTKDVNDVDINQGELDLCVE